MDIDVRNVLKLYDKYAKIQNYPICKIKDYVRIKTTAFCKYNPVISNSQIFTIIECSRTKKGMRVYHRLLALLAKNINVRDYAKFLGSFIDKNMSDMDVYKNVQKFEHRKLGGAPARKSIKSTPKKTRKYATIPASVMNCFDRNILHSQEYFYRITANILLKDTRFKLQRYLDVGCGDCKLAMELGKLLKLSNNMIYGTDIKEWSAYSHDKRKSLPINISVYKKGGPLPFKANMFSLVTVLMVLHHVEKLELMMEELNRITIMGGYILVREHDAMHSADYMLCDIEHMLFDIVKHKRGKDAMKIYYGKYYDWLEWDYIFNKYGFTFVESDYISNSIYHEMSPTRTYYVLYRKIKKYKSID